MRVAIESMIFFFNIYIFILIACNTSVLHCQLCIQISDCHNNNNRKSKIKPESIRQEKSSNNKKISGIYGMNELNIKKKNVFVTFVLLPPIEPGRIDPVS